MKNEREKYSPKPNTSDALMKSHSQDQEGMPISQSTLLCLELRRAEASQMHCTYSSVKYTLPCKVTETQLKGISYSDI